MDDVIPILFVIFPFVGGMVVLGNRAKERLLRLRLLEKVLVDPANDNATRQEAIRGLDDRGVDVGAWRQWLRTNLTPRRVFGVFAWGLIVAGGLILGLGSHYAFEPGVAILVTGLAILALPQIMRELEGRPQRS